MSHLAQDVVPANRFKARLAPPVTMAVSVNSYATGKNSGGFPFSDKELLVFFLRLAFKIPRPISIQQDNHKPKIIFHCVRHGQVSPAQNSYQSHRTAQTNLPGRPNTTLETPESIKSLTLPSPFWAFNNADTLPRLLIAWIRSRTS